MDQVSACRGTTLLLASMNDIQLSFTKYATAPYVCAEAPQNPRKVTFKAVVIQYTTWVFPVYAGLAIDSQNISTFP